MDELRRGYGELIQKKRSKYLMSKKFDPTAMALQLMAQSRKQKREQNAERKEISLRVVELNAHSQKPVCSEDILIQIFSYVTDAPFFLQKNLVRVCKMWYLLCHNCVPKLRIDSGYIRILAPHLLMERLRETLLHEANPRSFEDLFGEKTPQLSKI